MKRTALALMLAACGSHGLQGPSDLAVPLDLSVGTLPDLAFVPTCVVTGTNLAKFVVDSITIPMSSNDFAFDLNGDGHRDNRMGNIYGALIMNGLDVQSAATQEIASGANVILLSERSSDPQLTTDSCAATVEQQGLAHAPGSPLAPDPSIAPGNFIGSITSAWFNSSSPVTGPDVQMTLFLPLFTSLTKMPLHGAHIEYRNVAGGLMTGQINGAMLNSDVQMTVIPSMAQTLTQRLQSDMGGQSSTLSSLFDTGGSNDGSGCVTKTMCPGGNPPTGMPACKNPSYGARPGLCADQCDHLIDTCEVSTNMLVKNLLAPDVQLFQNGVYAPSAANKMKDSLSVGVGFTATSATF